MLATTVGVLLAILIDRVTEHFTGTEGGPVKDIFRSTDGGPATTILAGIVQGYESAVWSTLIIAATIFASIIIFIGVSPGPRGPDCATFSTASPSRASAC